MNCNGKCNGRMMDCCGDGKVAESGAGGSRGKLADSKSGWVQAAAVGLIVLFVLGILLRGM